VRERVIADVRSDHWRQVRLDEQEPALLVRLVGV
jgi:hypothetical protein